MREPGPAVAWGHRGPPRPIRLEGALDLSDIVNQPDQGRAVTQREMPGSAAEFADVKEGDLQIGHP